jgi:manganese/iron transport system ATP-binding protein
MNSLFVRTRRKGVRHRAAAPTVQLDSVSVVYTAGAGNATTNREVPQYASRYALRAITFRVDAGQRIAVIGPNGAGKSTLFKLIVGTIKPSSGTVNVYGYGPVGHTCIAYVPQRNQIDWSFPVTVQDVVMMGRVGQLGLFRWPRQRDRQIVHESLERVNAVHLARKQIGELSGGQQQRIFIARALAQQAELLLMDEPLSGLDGPSRDAIFQILDALRADSVTVMIATHDLDMAAERFDQIMLLNQQVIAYGSPAEVLQADNLLRAYGGEGFYLPLPD